MSSENSDAVLSRITAAWTDEGPNVEYHRRMQRWLRLTWPTLAVALDEAAKR